MNTGSRLIFTAGLLWAFSIGNAMAADKKTGSEKTCDSAKEELARRFGKALVPATGFKPYCLLGDFNGDRNADAFMAVKINSLPKNLSAIIPLYKPVPGEPPDPERDRDRYPAAGQYAYLAMHSAQQDGWAGASIYLIGGGSPVMMMSGYPEGQDMMEKFSRKAKHLRELEVPSSIKGDGIVVPTEAVEAVIFWNGKTYLFHEDPAGP
jgi:hypothetical protein